MDAFSSTFVKGILVDRRKCGLSVLGRSLSLLKVIGPGTKIHMVVKDEHSLSYVNKTTTVLSQMQYHFLSLFYVD